MHLTHPSVREEDAEGEVVDSQTPQQERRRPLEPHQGEPHQGLRQTIDTRERLTQRCRKKKAARPPQTRSANCRGFSAAALCTRLALLRASCFHCSPLIAARDLAVAASCCAAAAAASRAEEKDWRLLVACAAKPAKV